MLYLFLFFAGGAAWFFSTLVAGGAATLLLPILGFLLGAQAVAPVLTIASLIANPSRVAIFSAHIRWNVLAYLLPGTLAGAFAGGLAFSLLNPAWLEILIGLFLVSTIFQYRFGKSRHAFTMKTAWFLPLGFTVSLLSGIIGAVGPVLNPFFLNHGTEKEGLIATKSVNSLAMQIFKLLAYGTFGVITFPITAWGLALGSGAVAGVLLAKKRVVDMSEERFRLLLYIFMPLSGGLILLKGLATLLQAGPA